MKGIEIGILLLVLPIAACIVWYWQGKINEKKRIIDKLVELSKEKDPENMHMRGMEYSEGYIDALVDAIKII